MPIKDKQTPILMTIAKVGLAFRELTTANLRVARPSSMLKGKAS
jgi:hypothetical protein